MALFWRIWASVTLLTVVVLCIFVGLATMQFGSIHATLVGERLVVLAERTLAPFAAATRLGLPISGVRNAAALLERARQTDEDIIALHVFDGDGRVVHSTITPMPPTLAPDALAARTAANGAPWFRETAVGFIGGVELPARDGGIVVVYPRGGNVTHVRAMLAELALDAGLVVLLTAGLGALLLRWRLGPSIHHFEALDASLRDFERTGWRRAAGKVSAAPVRLGDPPPEVSDLRDRLDAAAAHYRATGRQLATPVTQEGEA
ncbi:hypothetical protein [Piscinibacter sp.]|uniref:hypothetical protein n=1 Tax=Piscinibacter sp. TaxID=1903157 RepID=UPI002CD3928D|nr:hypothetical protein [Albitalea sp.]HUG22012.1 hypothetical protein [Albitalea sp.]